MMLGRLLVISLFLGSLFVSMSAYAQECNWKAGFEQDIIDCDGQVYRVFTIEESKEILKKIQGYPKLELKVAQLNNKISLLDREIELKDERLQLFSESFQMDQELIGKLLDSPYAKQSFFKRPVVNLIAGISLAGLSFFLWEYADNLQP